MQKRDFDEAVESIVARDPRFRGEAYSLVKDALDYTLQQNLAEQNEESRTRHVCGEELLDGFRSHALEEFGPMAPTVLGEWGIFETRDVGEIVFNLIEAGVFGKTENDTLQDFEGVYSFEEAFVRPYLPPSRLREIASASGFEI